MRSFREIRYRLRQEAANLAMFASPPALPPGEPKTACHFPDPQEVASRLRGSACSREIEALAHSVMQHRFPLLGLAVETGPHIEWRRDYVHGVSNGAPYFRRVPYLDFARVGDHKLIWELNRHQHLVLLAQAYLLSGRREFIEEAFAQLESWMDGNPFLRGINWASALEVAFRALSWMWLWIMAGAEMPASLRGRFLNELFRHGCFLERNLSVYFSPNTHLLGEAVALHALGAIFTSWPCSGRWVRLGGSTVLEAMERQVRPDGSHFEQSAYYHVYALDFFLLHRALAQTPATYSQSLARMAEYLRALMGPSGILPYLGDDDGGRVFHPYGNRASFGRGTLATCAVLFNRPEWLWDPEDLACQQAWWFAPTGDRIGAEWRRHFPAPRLFRDAGVAVMAAGDRHVVIKAGPFGEGSGGHSHSDVLSLIIRIGEREVLIDSGTFTYVADPAARDYFRGSAAHNTIRIDGRDQALAQSPFRWSEKPEVAIHEWLSSADDDLLDASCSYGGFTHRRQVRLLKKGLVLEIADTVTGAAGQHSVEQFWLLDSEQEFARFRFPAPADRQQGWRSGAPGHKEPIPSLRILYRGSLPAKLIAVIDLH